MLGQRIKDDMYTNSIFTTKDDICRHNRLFGNSYIISKIFQHQLCSLDSIETHFALIFLHFGLTSLVNVSHRAGYPKKSGLILLDYTAY